MCIRDRKSAGKLTTSDKIDKVVTNRFAALPIFAVIMFLVYYISMVTVGTAATDWANDGLFGDGWHLFGIGSSDYEDASGAYSDALEAVNGFVTIEPDSEDFEPGTALETLKSYKPEGENPSVQIDVEDEETLEVSQLTVYYKEIPANADKDTTLGITYLDAVKYFEEGGESAFEEPDPASYGVWVPGIPVLIEQGLDAVNCVDWLKGLILDGIVAGVGAVLGFVPQMAILFLFLSILEDCGYMVRIAFVMDRVFRHFGLSGKSFIPLLISSGCGIPGIMASKTIEQDNDRRLTIMTATFIPCGAKLPVIALMGGVISGEVAGYQESSFIAPLMYFIGIVAVLVAAIILKKTKPFSGKPAPFVMELPPYRLPTAKAIFRHTWEKGAQYLRKMGGIIMIASIVIWTLGYYPDHDAYETVAEQQENSYIGQIGKAMEPVIEPLGFDWKLGIGILSGVGAKELVVSTLGVLYTNDAEADAVSLAERIPITPLVAFCYMVFVLIYFPCIATIVAIKQESGSWKWALFTAVYTTLLAWVMAFAIYRIGGLFV